MVELTAEDYELLVATAHRLAGGERGYAIKKESGNHCFDNWLHHNLHNAMLILDEKEGK